MHADKLFKAFLKFIFTWKPGISEARVNKNCLCCAGGVQRGARSTLQRGAFCFPLGFLEVKSLFLTAVSCFL